MIIRLASRRRRHSLTLSLSLANIARVSHRQNDVAFADDAISDFCGLAVDLSDFADDVKSRRLCLRNFKISFRKSRIVARFPSS